MPRTPKAAAPKTARAALPKMPARPPRAPAMPIRGAPNLTTRAMRATRVPIPRIGP